MKQVDLIQSLINLNAKRKKPHFILKKKVFNNV